jgi:hypothetical protein
VQELVADDEVGLALVEDERAVGQLVDRSLVVELRPGRGSNALSVQLCIDRVRADLAGVELAPDLGEANVVGATAERARAVPSGERRRLVEEEELGEATGLHERAAPPAAELEPAGDPALAVVAAADPTTLVVEAAAVSVDQPTRRVGDELAERRHPVLPLHLLLRITASRRLS